MELGSRERKVTLLPPHDVEERIQKHYEEDSILLHELAKGMISMGGQEMTSREVLVTICGKLQIVAMNFATYHREQSSFAERLHLFAPQFLRCLVATEAEADHLIALWKEHHATSAA